MWNDILNSVNAFVDRLTNRPVENIVRQFERTSFRLRELQRRRAAEVDLLQARIVDLSVEASRLADEAFRAGRVACRIDEVLE